MRKRDIPTSIVLALIACTCDAPARWPNVSAQPPVSAESAPSHFDPRVVQLPETSPERRALSGADDADIARLAEEGLAASTEVLEAGRLHFIAARAAARSNDVARARMHFEQVAGSTHPLARWARLELGALLAETEPEMAARALEPIVDDWAGQRRARTLRATSLARAGRADEAIPLLRALVAETPDHVGAATPGMPLAEILAARDDVASREEALALYRRVATRAPASDVGRDALARADTTLATLPEDRRDALATMQVADRFARAEALYNAMRHEEAEAAFATLASELDPLDPERCRARLMQGKALVRRRARDEAATHMEAVARDCTDEDVRAWALYDAARASSLRGRHDAAIALYERLADEHATHRLADDAVFRAAISLSAKGDEPAALAHLERVTTSFPDGDMRGEARFRIAWTARTAARADPANAPMHHARALTELDASIAEGTSEDRVDERGRAEYWRARTLFDLDRRDDATETYVGLARRLPLSYYAQQALARLDELAPERAGEVRAAMRDESPEDLVFPVRDELSSPELARAIELLCISEISLAESELEAFGALGEGADPDMLWLAAALLHDAGAYPTSSLLVRRRLRAFLDVMPTGRARHFWRMAYPHAFAPLIEDAAAREGVPASLVRAVAREESAFDPEAVSVARAYGLIQLIEPTARRFARELGLPASPRDLANPEINVPIGTRFLSFLMHRYPDNPALVPAAYNAGEGAVDRWIRQKHELPLDELIEEIPYDETRHYTRRVIQTWGTYSWLDEERLPTLASSVPARPR